MDGSFINNSTGSKNNFEGTHYDFDQTKKFVNEIELGHTPRINNIDEYRYNFENLNSSPQEEITGFEKQSINKNTNVDTNPNSQKYSLRTERPRKKKSNFFKYLALGLFCSIISSILSIYAVLYIIPESKFYKNSSFKEELDNKINSKVSEAVDAASSKIKHIEAVTGNEGLTVAEIASRVSPAVVGISKDITYNYFYEVESFGSGVIFSEDGFILTNYHVVENAKNGQVQVVFHDEKTAQARIVNYNKAMDVAVVKVDGQQMPGIATLGDSSDLKAGELAVAFGSPLGRQYLGSVSAGIISSPSRVISATQNGTAHVIQTDAAINPGNSGGPLVNSNGQVIGINSAKISENTNGQKVEGMGFAIPINEIKPLLDKDTENNLIVDNPNITNQSTLNTTEYRGVLLGISVGFISGDTAKDNNYPEGLLITKVNNGSPADRAGIKVGDIILTVDGKRVKDGMEIKEIIKDMKQGDKVVVQIQKNLNELPKNITVTF